MNSNIVLEEISYKSVRSSGAGGQHVNKVASKVMIHFNITISKAFLEEE